MNAAKLHTVPTGGTAARIVGVILLISGFAISGKRIVKEIVKWPGRLIYSTEEGLLYEPPKEKTTSSGATINEEIQNPKPMQRLRDLISTDAPVIFTGNWNKVNLEGWRWAENIPVSATIRGSDTILKYQKEYGRDNVALGHPWSPRQFKPSPNPQQFGIYVRDLETAMATFGTEFDEWWSNE